MGIHSFVRWQLSPRAIRRPMAIAFGLAASAAVAGPILIEESAKIASPDPSYDFGGQVAVDGDFAIVSGSRASTANGFLEEDDSAWLFQRQSSGAWTPVRKLVESVQTPAAISIPMTLDMRDGIAAIADVSGHVFERTASGWVGGPAFFGGNFGDVEVEGGTIFGTEGSCTWSGVAWRKNVAGNWQQVAQVVGQYRECDDEFVGDDGDISGTSMIVANLGDALTGEGPQARIYEGPFGTTPTMTVIVPPQIQNVLSLPHPVAIAGASVLVGASNSRRVHAYAKETSGAWAPRGHLPNPAVINAGAASTAEIYGNLAVVGYPVDPLRGTDAGSVGVFERNPDGSYRYVARLAASDAAVGAALGGKVEISGRRIIASARNAAYVFDLPPDLSQPATLQDDFEDGNANGWTTIPGSTFQVVASAGSSVYRQSSLAGDAGAIMDASARRNQAIQADIRPTAFASGGERWFGLVVRYTDPGNYYYVTLRNTNVVQLKRMHNGSFTTLAQKALPVPLNRTYRVRLEAVGTRLRVFVDNTFVAEATDTTLAQGNAGIFMYKTSADYDNVVVTSDPHVRLVNDTFTNGLTLFWSFNAVGAWETTLEGSNRVLAQTSLAGDARAILTEPAQDQIVQARAKALSFASGGERWFGLLARYTDEQNYYYLTVRNTDTISLRKLVNGTPVVLDTASLPVTIGQWYTLRLEAVGDRVRGYVNGNLLVEATDASHPSGTYGAMVYRTQARYDDFTAMQP